MPAKTRKTAAEIAAELAALEGTETVTAEPHERDHTKHAARCGAHRSSHWATARSSKQISGRFVGIAPR